MEGITRVTARIEEIQAMVRTHTAPMGAFSSQLARAQAAQAPSAPEETDGDESMASSLALDIVGGADYVRSATLGSVIGLQPSAPITVLDPVDGIFTSRQLEMYLFEHQVEQRNGHLHAEDLIPVSGSWHGTGRLLPPAAASWEKMREAAAADGIDLMTIDTYRTWESQDRAHRQHLAGIKKANVLPAGTSEHGNGLAVDITNGSIISRNDTEYQWLDRNAARFGWHGISNEAWHWEFRGVQT